jgi:tetratricopeptide (TPR) repeat protein
MTSALHELYASMLASSGKLKLRAKALLAEGGPDATFKASLLYHEAARAQRRATAALPWCPPASRLGSAVEECWCLVEGLDPPCAADAWASVLQARQDVEATAAEAILSRLGPRYDAQHRAFVSTVRGSPALLAVREARMLVGLDARERAKARKETASVLGAFPGATTLWWMSFRLAEADGDKPSAWKALGRARELDPENPRFLAMSLLVAAWARPPAIAETYLASFRGSLERAPAEVCLMYALAEITLARKTTNIEERRARWMRARRAADAGIARATTEGLHRNLLASQLLLDALLTDRQPTMEILYLAGLTELAAVTNPKADVVDLFTARLRGEAFVEERKAA